MRRRSTRHPFVSFAMFLVVCSMAYVTWTYRHELRSEKEAVVLDHDTPDRVEDMITEEFEHDACFFDRRGHLTMRPSERRYRLDIVVENTKKCEERAKDLCERIAKLIYSETEIVATVIAFDTSGREVGRYVM